MMCPIGRKGLVLGVAAAIPVGLPWVGEGRTYIAGFARPLTVARRQAVVHLTIVLPKVRALPKVSPSPLGVSGMPSAMRRPALRAAVGMSVCFGEASRAPSPPP